MTIVTNERTTKIVVCHLDEDPAALELTKINLESMDPMLEVRTFQHPADLIDELKRSSCSCIVASYMQNAGTIDKVLPQITDQTNAPIILYTIYDENEIENFCKSNQIRYYVQKQAKLEHYEQLVSAIHEVINNVTATSQPLKEA